MFEGSGLDMIGSVFRSNISVIHPSLYNDLLYSIHLVICWKQRQQHSCLPLFKPTNQGTLHPFSTTNLVWVDSHEGGAVRLSR